MNKKLIWSSMAAAAGLAAISLLNGIMKHELNINAWISILSYFGVYGIALYLSRNNSGEKIILTLIDVLAIVILVAYSITAFSHFAGGLSVVVILIAVVGLVGAVWSIVLNNKFKSTSAESDATENHQSKD